MNKTEKQSEQLRYHLIHRGDKMAVKRYGAKKATRLFDSEDQCMEYLKAMKKDMLVYTHRKDGTIKQATAYFKPHFIKWIDVSLFQRPIN